MRMATMSKPLFSSRRTISPTSLRRTPSGLTRTRVRCVAIVLLRGGLLGRGAYEPGARLADSVQRAGHQDAVRVLGSFDRDGKGVRDLRDDRRFPAQRAHLLRQLLEIR